MLQLNSGAGGEYLATQLCWAAARLVVICLSPIKSMNGLLLVRFFWCTGHEPLRPQ